MESKTSAPAQQRPEIDGLRAVAILPVVLFHAGLGCRSGFVGVDVFFAISGFLISGIIFRELAAGKFTYTKFWERRIRRIVPVLLFFTAATVLAGWRILHPRDFADLGEQAASALAGVANFKMRLLSSGGYWAPQSQNVPLLHTWSLAVEEQFYLFMPFILWALHRWLRARMGLVLGVMLAGSLALSLATGTGHPEFNFYLLPTRAWEMLLGCLGAYALHRGLVLSRPVAQAAGALGLAMILFSAFGLRESAVWPNAWTLLPTLGAVLILISPGPATAGGSSLVVRLLSLAPLRFIGLISYSLYLWHWPVIVFFKEYHPDTVTLGERWLLVAASVLLAALSWQCVEQPFRNRLKSFRVATTPLVLGAGAVWAALLVAALFAAKNFSAANQAFEAKLPPEVVRVIFHRPGLDSIVKYDASTHLHEGGIPLNLRNRTPRVVVLGSSHGQPLGPVISALCEAYDIPCVMFTQGGTSAMFAGSNPYVIASYSDNATKRERDELVKAYIARWNPELVIIAGRWAWEIPYNWGPNPTESTALFWKAFTQTVAWLDQHSSQVVIMGQSPPLPLPGAEDNVINIWKRYRLHNNSMPVFFEPGKEGARRRQSIAAFRGYAGSRLTVLDPEPLFKNADGSLRYYSDRGVLYYDDNHLNSLGSMDLKPLLEPFFAKLARTREGQPGAITTPPAPH